MKELWMQVYSNCVKNKFFYENKEAIEAYAKEHTIRECADFYEVNYFRMVHILRKLNIKAVKDFTGRRNSNYKHGKKKTRLYDIYCGMKSRCYCESNVRYSLYGGRGIKICDEWLLDFKIFFDWSMNNGYSDSLTIDRIDVNGDYSPDNCRWITIKEQQSNRRNNHLITYKGETKTLKEWSVILGFHYDKLRWRIKNWSLDKAFETK